MCEFHQPAEIPENNRTSKRGLVTCQSGWQTPKHSQMWKKKTQHPAGGRRSVESRLWHLFKHILHILMRRSKCCFNLAAQCLKTHPAVGFKTRIWCDNIMKSTESVFWLQLSHNVLKISCIYVTLATWELHFKAVSFQHRVTVEKTTEPKKKNHPEQSSSCTTGQYRLH